LSLLRGVSRFSSGPGRCNMTVRNRPTSLSTPWVCAMAVSVVSAGPLWGAVQESPE
jgi:hypothetical protein